MPYTPVELRHVKLGRRLFGYDRRETEAVLGAIADSFEGVWRERGELSDRVEEMEAQLTQFRQREELLSQTLLAAERSAAEAKEAARREAELIIAEAHQEARFVARAAQRERERLLGEARRIEALLRSALDLVEQGARRPAGEAPPPEAEPVEPTAQAAEEHAEDEEPEEEEPEEEEPDWPSSAGEIQAVSWRDRSDTREYAALLPDLHPTLEPAPEASEEPPAEAPREHVALPPVEDESGEAEGPGRGFDWG